MQVSELKFEEARKVLVSVFKEKDDNENLKFGEVPPYLIDKILIPIICSFSAVLFDKFLEYKKEKKRLKLKDIEDSEISNLPVKKEECFQVISTEMRTMGFSDGDIIHIQNEIIEILRKK